MIAFGEETAYATMFEDGDQTITPDLAAVSKVFGAHAVRISHVDEVGPAISETLGLGKPSVIEVMVDTCLAGRVGRPLVGGVCRCLVVSGSAARSTSRNAAANAFCHRP